MTPNLSAIISRSLPRARVFVRVPGSTDREMALGALGTITHQARLGDMVFGVFVQTDAGRLVYCLPRCVRPAADLGALLGVEA